MECEKYIEFMSEHLDGTISQADDRELTAHLEKCESCRELFDVMSEAREELCAMLEEPPEELSRGVMSGIQSDKGGGKNRRFVFGRFTAVAAAAVVLVLAVYYALPGIKSNDLTADDTSAYTADEYNSSDLNIDAAIMENSFEKSEAAKDMQSDSSSPDDVGAEPGDSANDLPDADGTESMVSEPATFMAPPALPYSQSFSAILVYSGVMPEELENYTTEQGTETEYFVFVPSDEAEPLIESGKYTVFSEGGNISADADFAIVVVYGGLAG